MLKYLKKLRCLLLHRDYSYGLPDAGRLLKWNVTCLQCDNKFVVTRLNTPQWLNPFIKDKSRPKTWEESAHGYGTVALLVNSIDRYRHAHSEREAGKISSELNDAYANLLSVCDEVKRKG
jgi:hypothetical protein